MKFIGNDINKNQSNYQDLIKALAIAVMIIDHCGLLLLPNLYGMRLIGRGAMPIFCFFAGYNFHGKIRHNILIYGLIFHAISSLIFNNFEILNILINIYLGQWYLLLFCKQLGKFEAAFAHIVILSFLWPLSHHYLDYGSVVIAIMIMGYYSCASGESKLPMCMSLILTFFNTLGHGYTHVVFGYLSEYYVIMLIGYLALVYFLVTRHKLESSTIKNWQVISRYSLAIYFWHFTILELFWLYLNKEY